MQAGLILLMASPYTAYLPLIYMSLQWWKDRKEGPWSGIHKSLALLCVFSFLAAAINQSLPSFIGSLGLLFLVGASWRVQQTIQDENRAHEVLVAIWQVGMVTGILGLVEKALSYMVDMTWVGSWFWSPNFIPSAENYRIYATYGNPNVTGMVFGWLLLVSVYLWDTELGKKSRYLLGIMVFGTAVIATGSKGATVAMLAALVVYGILSKNKTLRRILLLSFAAVVVLALLSPEINHKVHSKRVDWWIESFAFIFQRPWTGWGIWGAMDHLGNIHSHNAWISLLFFFGIPGFVAYLWWKGLLYRRLLLFFKGGSRLAILLIASQAFFVVQGIVDFTWMTPQGGALFFGLCGITAGLTENQGTSGKVSKTRAQKRSGKKIRIG
ncbi:O-antigen ligase family protein [Alkalibacter rhizosphaerae]|uniref:O-antigen ligase family protein n=1 Tax=Alkalibacter rhizosphaerae TaxID=2815577 RepID=A0A974XDN9_9FIRM|nr:O-antigen ligase family protein [Alkalibacter rhizosphaerae]QSX07919.1 O-antigen ligase family protein [Alkalibacter rhizosphaerae]